LRSNAFAILDQITGTDAQLRREIEVQTLHACVAQMIYAARTQAGLTQQALAKRIKTTQSVITRLEDSDYEGHSLSMLHRIAKAVGCRLDVRFLGSGIK